MAYPRKKCNTRATTKTWTCILSHMIRRIWTLRFEIRRISRKKKFESHSANLKIELQVEFQDRISRRIRISSNSNFKTNLMPNLIKKSKQNRQRSQRFKLHMIRRRTGIDLEFLEIDPATCTCFHILAGQIGVRSWCGRETNNYISGLYPFTPIQYSFVEMIDPKPNFKTPRKKETYDSEV